MMSDYAKTMRWIIEDHTTGMVLSKLPVFYDRDKWSREPDPSQMPQDNPHMVWDTDVKKALKFPSACAVSLQKTFKQCGRPVNIKPGK